MNSKIQAGGAKSLRITRTAWAHQRLCQRKQRKAAGHLTNLPTTPPKNIQEAFPGKLSRPVLEQQLNLFCLLQLAGAGRGPGVRFKSLEQCSP